MFTLIGTLIAVLLLPPVPVADAACADVHIMGVRGSGQAGYGEQVETYLDAIAAVVGESGASVTDEAIDYPAISLADSLFALFNGDYDRSVDAGAVALNDALDTMQSSCPTSGLVVIGYSQGAQVIKRTLGDRPVGDRLVSVVFLADLTRDITQPGVVTVGSSGVDDEGSLGAVAVPDHIRPLTIDVCAPFDAVCTGFGLDFAAHIQGYAVPAPEALDAFDADLAQSSIMRRQIPR